MKSLYCVLIYLFFCHKNVQSQLGIEIPDISVNYTMSKIPKFYAILFKQHPTKPVICSGGFNVTRPKRIRRNILRHPIAAFDGPERKIVYCKTFPFCSATVIREKWLITAANCLWFVL